MTYLNLFAGAGGWELGLAAAGVPVAGSLGLDPRQGFLATRDAAEYPSDGVESESLIYDRSAWPAGQPHRGLVGQPPCPTFSMSGSGSGRREIPSIIHALDELSRGRVFHDVVNDHPWEDPRTKGIVIPMAYLASATALDPFGWVILEEVPPALPVFEEYARLLRERFGYATWTGLLRAEMFGLPQYRKRAILMARLPEVCEGAIPDPTPSHQRYRKGIPQGTAVRPEDAGLLPWVSMADALGRGAVHRPAGTVGTGVGYTSWARKHMFDEYRDGLWLMREQLDADPTRINIDGGQLHPNLTVSETGILQGFPADHPWSGPMVSQRAQAGSAMPPPLVTACANTLFHRSADTQLPLAA